MNLSETVTFYWPWQIPLRRWFWLRCGCVSGGMRSYSLTFLGCTHNVVWRSDAQLEAFKRYEASKAKK